MILLLCTGNTCRSVMAAAWLRFRRPDWIVLDAGVRPGPSNGRAVDVLRKAGLPAEQRRGQSWLDYRYRNIDWVIALSDDACRTIKRDMPQWVLSCWYIADPAEAVGSSDEQQAVYEKTFQVVREKVDQWLEAE